MKILFIVLLLVVANSHADPFIQITDKSKIEAILSQIPVNDKQMNYQNIGQRISNIGMTVGSIMVTKITKKSEIESSEDRIGDVIYQIYTSNPSKMLTDNYCDMLGSPGYRKRGKTYFPQDRTAMWLMTSRCETPQ